MPPSPSPAPPPPAAMPPPREHVERIRRERFFIGRGERNPLAEDMHQAVNYLSQEIYSKDVHFLMELIQNAEDNDYPSGVAPSLEFLITSKDITGLGAPSTLLVFNNENGFSPSNVESICRVGKSTKKGNRHQGYIGEKGIGFKSVFLISRQPHIFSNGYRIKFNEDPSSECNIGYIVPEWVESKPSLSDIQELHGSSKPLPTTTIILPLKSEKVDVVKKQLSSIHPETLLFLTKIRRLSVREDNSDPKCSTINEISMESEKNYQVRKNIHAESYTLHLSAQENKEQEECGYYMWRQKFPVKPENRVDMRADIDEYVITLAFPHGQRLSRGKQSSPGVYAFLPTEILTNFPFIIQADFLLASSRETILFDSMWNKGILECVPSAFLNAFVALVKSSADAPAMSLPSMFNFLPVHPSHVPFLEPVRSAIKDKVRTENIMPCESYTLQKMFCKPGEVGRIKPGFWTILKKAQECGVDLKNLSAHGTYILSCHFDKSTYDSVLAFLDVKNVSAKWYAKCIEGSNLVYELPEELYIEFLYFLATNWDSFSSTSMKSIPLLKYVDRYGAPTFWSIYKASQSSGRLCISSHKKYIQWLISWNQEFPSCNQFFMPLSTQTALYDFSKNTFVTNWLRGHVNVQVVSVHGYGLNTIAKLLDHDRRSIVAFAHFLYHSFKMGHIEGYFVTQLCHAMPIINIYGKVVKTKTNIVVPAKGSKWVRLMGTNPWKDEKYTVLAADYMSSGSFARKSTPDGRLFKFLTKHLQVSDVPSIDPPDASFPTVSSQLTVDNALLLLEWLRNLKSRGVELPAKFMDCIRRGSWLVTSVGDRPPSESFMSSAEWTGLLQIGSSFVDIPIIDQQFYQNKLNVYKEELKTIGVRFEFQEASVYIGSHLMSIAESNMLTRDNVYSLLQLIRFLQENNLSTSALVDSVNSGQWMKSTLGYRSPANCIIYDSDWAVASRISILPFLDVQFYGDSILDYKPELELLGVLVGFKDNYTTVIDNFEFSSNAISSEATVLILKCVRYVSPCDDFITKLKGIKWIKTNVGFCVPSESFLIDPEWECLLKVFGEVALIDLGFYGSVISSYKEELKKTGLIAGHLEASNALALLFKQMVSKSSLTKANVLALLASYRQLKSHQPSPMKLFNCLRDEKWLHTSQGFRRPSDAILFDESWWLLSPIASLPFINDEDTGYGLGLEIYDYKDELKDLGVTVEVKDGANFVIVNLKIPNDQSAMPAYTVLSLLECIQNWIACQVSLPKDFLDKICKKWLRTTMGYKSPNECLLFDHKHSAICMEDGPFIDEVFYGSEIASFKDALAAIGVVINIENGCDLVAQHMKFHSCSDTISRIYMYLMDCNWKPVNNSSNWVWVPSGIQSGEWVSPANCVLHDRDNLFSSQLHVLDKYYNKKVLGFFALVLGVRFNPNAEDHCKLWSKWEASVTELTMADCSAFWGFVLENWTKATENLLSACVIKVPVFNEGKIILSKKEDVFIPDDLLIKDLFDKLPQESIFIWYPPASLPYMSRARFNCIYNSIGVRTISESVEWNESFTLGDTGLQEVNVSTVIKHGLLQIVTAFLANPVLDIPAKERHKMVSHLLSVTILETNEPITAGYSVKLSSGRHVSVKASRMLRWGRDNSKLYMQRCDQETSHRGKIEFATYFADEISQGLLFEMEDHIPELTELVKFGYLLDFQDSAVEFLLKSKNLQLFPEDEEFLDSAMWS
uniref:Sacsin/Nov domain-containing protein n=1 Tax=Oryza nivara TaxID=4536 RepID=A0A0E0J2C0_ORYNI